MTESERVGRSFGVVEMWLPEAPTTKMAEEIVALRKKLTAAHSTNDKLRSEIIEEVEAQVSMYNGLQAIREQGHVDCEECRSHDSIATAVVEQVDRPPAVPAISKMLDALSKLVKGNRNYECDSKILGEIEGAYNNLKKVVKYARSEETHVQGTEAARSAERRHYPSPGVASEDVAQS